MDSRHARYLAVGILMGCIALAALQVSALAWLAAIAVAVVVTWAVVLYGRQQGGVENATPDVAPAVDPMPAADPLPVADAPERVDTPVVTVEVVRVADEASGMPTVWLHRSGGRRVHRFADGHGWIVQQVSTKDPDNPRKRIIGEPLSFTAEEESVVGADNLARGILPRDVDTAREYGVPPVAMAEARRRKVRLTGGEQARRLAGEWGVLTRA